MDYTENFHEFQKTKGKGDLKDYTPRSLQELNTAQSEGPQSTPASYLFPVVLSYPPELCRVTSPYPLHPTMLAAFYALK
jgi:hypothetical protein